MPSGPMAPNSRQRYVPHEPALNQPRSAFGGTCVPAGTEGVGNLEVVPAGNMHRALHIEMLHLLNAIMRRSCIETTAERTMNPAVDHVCRSGLTPCPRLKNGRLRPLGSDGPFDSPGKSGPVPDHSDRRRHAITQIAASSITRKTFRVTASTGIIPSTLLRRFFDR